MAKAGLCVLPLLLLAAGCSSLPTCQRAYIASFERAERDGRAFAAVTQFEPGIDLESAYRIQRRLNARRVARGDRIAGYKSSLTSPASMKQRKSMTPLTAVLFESGRVRSGGTVSLCGYRKASFELKLGFIATRPIGTPPGDTADLAAAMQVVPVIDLPDIAYRDPVNYSAIDMVAANVSAARFVLGGESGVAGLDLDGLRASMQRDGAAVTAGRGGESMGIQWETLRFVVSSIIARGYRIKRGDLLVTGKIGERTWLDAGVYRASYGPLGEVAFTVAPCSPRS